MNLPKKDKDGLFYISYSQINSWKAAKGFNTGKKGYVEYIRRYFLGEKFEDTTGFAEFGKDVEDYITERKGSEKFTDKERQVLEQVVPLGIFQKEFKLQFPEHNFYVIGYIDDCSEDMNHIRDYKTASFNSSKQYYEPDYKQLDIYSLAIKQDYGFIPDHLEVVCIERLGNGFRGGRKVMSVGDNIWYINRKTDEQRLADIYNDIIATTKEISEYWTVFEKLNIKK